MDMRGELRDWPSRCVARGVAADTFPHAQCEYVRCNCTIKSETGGIMLIYTSTQARAKISAVLDAVSRGEVVEITRRNGAVAVVISKAEFEAYQKVKLDNECDSQIIALQLSR